MFGLNVAGQLWRTLLSSWGPFGSISFLRSLSLSLSLPLFVSVSIHIYIYISLSLPLFISLSVSLYTSLSMSPCLHVSLHVSLCVSLSLSLYLSLSLSLFMSLSVYLCLSVSPSMSLYNTSLKRRNSRGRETLWQKTFGELKFRAAWLKESLEPHWRPKERVNSQDSWAPPFAYRREASTISPLCHYIGRRERPPPRRQDKIQHLVFTKDPRPLYYKTRPSAFYHKKVRSKAVFGP